MLYASTAWTSCSVENIQKVFRLQKRAARVILGADTKANSVKLFKQLGWVPFYHEARINKLILVYQRIFGERPPYLTQTLVRNVDVSGRSSRHGHLNLICPRFKRETEGGRSFSVSTSRLWNMLPTHIKNQSTLTSFKKSIFKHFMDSYKELDHFIIKLFNFSFLLLVFTNAFYSFLIFIFLGIIARFKTLFIL